MSNLAYILKIILVILISTNLIWILHAVEDDDKIYVKETGMTKAQLLKSGKYVSIDLFKDEINKTTGDQTQSASTPKVASDPGLEPRMAVPIERAQRETKFIYYNKTGKYQMELNADRVKKLGWDSTAQVKIIIHGLFDSSNTLEDAATNKVKDAYVKSNAKLNIIQVDWSTLSAGLTSYASFAADNTYPVGKVVGEFILFLQKTGLTKMSLVHIIGFSLGAHVAGIAGKYAGGMVARITGLDPAGPGFGESLNKEERLDLGDAKFVDIIHTNMGNIYPWSRVSFGTTLAIGHVDFYPNGGKKQPDCGGFLGILNVVGVCSHTKATEYFQESIKGKEYKSCECKNWDHFTSGKCGCPNPVLMGEKCNTNAKGARYLKI